MCHYTVTPMVEKYSEGIDKIKLIYGLRKGNKIIIT